MDVVNNMNNICNIQLNTLDKYFDYISNTGYLKDTEVNKILTSVLLVDALNYFKEFLTKDFVNSVNKILKELNCCSCFVDFDNIITCEEIKKPNTEQS